MKKMFLIVACVMAMFGTVSAKNDVDVKNYDTVLLADIPGEQENVSANIETFYNIDRLVILNEKHIEVKVYDSEWNLVIDTTDSIDTNLKAGNYYVVSTSRIKMRYVA